MLAYVALLRLSMLVATLRVLVASPLSEVCAVAGDTHLRHCFALHCEAFCGTCAQALKCLGEQALQAVDLGEMWGKLIKTEGKGRTSKKYG